MKSIAPDVGAYPKYTSTLEKLRGLPPEGDDRPSSARQGSETGIQIYDSDWVQPQSLAAPSAASSGIGAKTSGTPKRCSATSRSARFLRIPLPAPMSRVCR